MTDFIDIMEDEDAIRDKLEELRREHKSLDDDIDNLGTGGQPIDFLQLQRMKSANWPLRT